jgi:hypothetical protein
MHKASQMESTRIISAFLEVRIFKPNEEDNLECMVGSRNTIFTRDRLVSCRGAIS